MMDYAAARHNMVEGQIRTNKVIGDALIAALRLVPRELFLPNSLRPLAYLDEDLAVSESRIMLEPMTFARLAEEANIQPTDVVLDLACTYGYTTAVLSKLSHMVFGVESDADMVAAANQHLSELEFDKATVIEGDIAAGYAQAAPYNIIFINGAVQTIPQQLIEQLSDGGKILCMDRSQDDRIGTAVMYQKIRESLSKRVLFDAFCPVLPEFTTKQEFVF